MAGTTAPDLPPAAALGGLVATGLRDVTDDLGALDGSGRWAVVLPYAGVPVLARFDRWAASGAGQAPTGSWRGPSADAWSSSLDRAAYEAAVAEVRERIAAGDVYQANVCRVLSADLPDPHRCDVAALHRLLADGNPAPYGGFVRLPSAGVHVATASPELFLRREGRLLSSGPIKGTATTADGLLPKDAAENVMIVDLVRNDLSRVCRTGSVEVPALLRVEQHPGLVHLVSVVSGLLRDDVGWAEVVEAAFPPGSVTGAPKSSALRVIDDVETASREVYCGAVGWVDADTGQAELAVAIRTFWLADGQVRFGTGAGITWGSDPAAEWEETRLKAHRLVTVAAGAWEGGAP
ncbi:MAG: chorismate-binding protein [Candidatus Nanopelagicales bacterium]